MSADTTSSAILKNELHRLVVETDNPQVLRQVKSIFEILLHSGEEEDWWDSLSEKEKCFCKKACNDSIMANAYHMKW
ncbi:MAG: hypothetical protein HUU01_06955 [Saprospiraceae bacterium]|nr:hypothetical protein [Saprospiraceae bacterium]